MIKKIIEKLRNKFEKYEIDGYIVPKNDDFFSEYSTKDRLKIISNFSGSAGYAIILKNKNYLDHNKYLYYEKSKKDKSEYEKYFNETHDIIKDLSIGDVSYTILVNQNL